MNTQVPFATIYRIDDTYDSYEIKELELFMGEKPANVKLLFTIPKCIKDAELISKHVLNSVKSKTIGDIIVGAKFTQNINGVEISDAEIQTLKN